MLVNIEIVVW